MIVDSHLHLMQKKNFDVETNRKLGMKIPDDTPLPKLVSWLKEAGVEKAVVMGQDMSRIWKTSFGEDYVLKAQTAYPHFFLALASVEPLNEANSFNQIAYDHLCESVEEHGFRGVLLTPPYGQYNSNDRTAYPFYKFAQEAGIIVQFHHSAQIGPSILAPTRYASMFNLNDIMIDFPGMKIVVEHLGYPFSEHLFVLMANDKNLWADLAMTFVRPTWLAWNLVLAKEYGVVDRIMYASDYVAAGYDLLSQNPAEDFRSWIDFLRRELNRICDNAGWPTFSKKEIEGFLGGNAARLYGLETGSHQKT